LFARGGSCCAKAGIAIVAAATASAAAVILELIRMITLLATNGLPFDGDPCVRPPQKLGTLWARQTKGGFPRWCHCARQPIGGLIDPPKRMRLAEHELPAFARSA
jgi:hypothetical protein